MEFKREEASAPLAPSHTQLRIKRRSAHPHISMWPPPLLSIFPPETKPKRTETCRC